jgi:hypothetical protein
MRILCLRCRHFRAVDVHGNVDCDLKIGGKMKVRCREFEEVKER